MAPIIHFKCRACEGELTIQPGPEHRFSCPSCHKDLEVSIGQSLVERRIVESCVVCGHDTLYIQKDFNRTLGIAVVVIGIAASVYFFQQREPWYSMGALAVTALVDFLIYSLVGDVTVCYSCHAIYRGFQRNPEHEPFDLKKLEKYGGRAPRFGP